MDVPIIISATEAKPEMMAVLAWQVVWTQYLVDSLTFTKVSMHMDITGKIFIVFSLHQWKKILSIIYYEWFIFVTFDDLFHMYTIVLGSVILSIRNFSLAVLIVGSIVCRVLLR